MRLIASLLIATICVSACANPGLRDIRQPGQGPDEFIIEPNKPLTTPQNLTALPQPTPGGSNLTDNDPLSDAIVALGGRPDTGGGIPSSDAALVSSASRFGVQPDIRRELDETDAEFRRRQARLANIRIFPEDRYNQAYESESLEPAGTADSWRRAGVQTPSYPPSN